MGTAELPLLVLPDATPGGLAGLPPAAANIFQRVIRNPRPDAPHARERECTEMLAAVLINAPALRRHLFRWLAGLTEGDPDLIDELEFEIDTEQYVGAKRDDLGVVGRRPARRDGPPALLWMVEVKVGSGFHRSRAQRLDEGGEALEGDDRLGTPDEELLVNQLKNYDDWLCVQKAEHRAGFVLGLTDLTNRVRPLNLRGTWTCVSWTGLGLAAKAALDAGRLPPADDLLGRHLLGFVGPHLWRTDEMPDDDAPPRLDFNDVALIRAFTAIGRACEAKVNALVAGVAPVFRGAGFEGEVMLYPGLYRQHACSSADVYLVPGHTKDADPYVDVSVGSDPSVGDYVGVYLIMSPKHPRWAAAAAAVSPAVKKLKARDAAWSGPDADEGVVAGLHRPLTTLLAAADQQRALHEFVRASLTDLRASGAIDAVTLIVGGSRDARAKSGGTG